MRWKCTVAYDGSDFEGWQAQASGHTIQQFLERRLSVIFERPVRIHGSGRTDSGVHATGQVFHVDGDWPHGSETLIRALRAGFPDSIQVFAAEVVPDTFHARYSVTGKRYIYRMLEGFASPFETRYCYSLGNHRLDLSQMNAAAVRLLGKHDFSAFGANSRAARTVDPVKDLRVLEVHREGSRLTLVTEGSGYLYKMVRTLAGCLIEVGKGKLTPDEVEAILVGRVRTAAVCTAPARGLTLERVDYD